MRKPLLLVPLLSLAACNDPPPTPTAVRAAIATDVGYIVTQANTAFSASAPPSTAALAMLGKLVPGSSSSASGSSGFGTLTSWLPERIIPTKRSRLAADTGGQLDPQPVIDYLNNTLFTDANSLGEGVYQVPAAVACTVTSVDDTGTETTSLDSTCAAKFAQADVRIRVEENDATLTFALQLDANHDEPFTVSLAHDAVSLTIDLDNADHAIAALASIFAETPPNVRLAGQATARLQILGAGHAVASLTIDRDLAIAMADPGQDLDGAQALKIASAQAPVFALDLDGTAHTGSADLGLGATTAQIPSNGDVIAVDLPGVTAHATFGSGAPLVLTGLGLGDRTFAVSKNGARAIGIDVNPDDHRTLDATVAPDGTLAVAPVLDVRYAIDRAVLGGDAGPYDLTQVRLAGSVAPNGDGLKVVTGTFSVVTNPAAYGVVATAGQCVADTEVSDGSGALYDQWLSATCQ